MNLPAKTISIGWIGIATIVPSAYITYYLYDSYNPTGNAWLKESGYVFGRPVFAEHEKPNQGCSKNLFGIDEDDADSDTRLYGCTVMKIDIYNTGHEFTTPNIDPKYINFSSEIALRKGDNGWVINTRINNYSTKNQIDFNYLLSTYKYESKQWNKVGTFSIWPDLNAMGITNKSFDTTRKGSDGNSVKIETQNKQLNITTPKGDLLNNYLVKSDPSKQTAEQKKFIRSKQYVGLWIPDEREEKWIFEDIDIQFRDQDKSIFLCKSIGVEKCSSTSYSHYKWQELETAYSNWQEIIKDQENSAQGIPKATIKSMILDIQNEKGKWVGVGDICSLQWVRNLNEEQKKHLKMFCAADKPKSKYLTTASNTKNLLN